MPGTVKSELLPDADKSHKCDSQEKICWMLCLPLDKSHFITVKWCIRESCGFYGEHQLRHYCIITSEELIDIISTFEPILRIVK